MFRSPVLAACALTLLATPSVGASGPAGHSRVYLLSSESDFLYWSVDRHDPELDVGRVERQCSPLKPKGTPGYKPCGLTFLPATRLAAPIAWNASSPLRFHLALEVETPGSHTVHLAVHRQSGSVESPPATEVAPGIWEGALTTGGPIPADTWSLLSVVVKRQVSQVTISLKAAGGSYVELPEPVPSAGVPQLLKESPEPEEEPATLETELRWFAFNDDEWSVTSFQGDLQETRTFDLTLERDTVFVLAWVELFRTPFAHDVVRGRDPDSRKLTDGARAELLRGGERLARGSNPGLYGLGTETVVAVDVAAGPLSLQISPTEVWPTDYQQGSPYRAHVLAVHGERTLAAMRWTSMFAEYPGLGPANAPFVARCPGVPPEMVPVTDEVTSWRVDLDADSVSPLGPNWTLGYLLPPNSWYLCGELGTSDALRFTFPFKGVNRVGAMVAPDSTYTEWRDTVFEFEVRYAYTPPPPPEPV